MLLSKAKEILNTNWKEGFSVPTNNLYPFQWNWDSGFISIGQGHHSIEKAILELNSLFSGQWENGMVPHIIFHSENETSYFPNFDFWNSNVNAGAPLFPKSSGITQPAVHGFVLEALLNKFPNDTILLDFVKEIFPKIVKYHKFLYTYRDPNQEGLMFIYHPWESGRDNSPLWDESLDRINIKEGIIPNYKRRDTELAPASERPTSEQYDRYVFLLELGKKHQYDKQEIAKESPFLIQDTMMNAILIKSNESLINIANRFGFDQGELKEWQAQSKKSFSDKLWNEDLGFYTPFDLRAEKHVAFKEIGGLVPLYAGIPSDSRAKLLANYLQNLHDRNFYLCPSFDVDSSLFDSKRYWRGPIWPQMNWMIHHGLKEYGYDKLSEIVKSDLLELVEKLGFYEYFESQKSIVPTLDKGYGGGLFSWTASSVIDLIKS